MEQEEVQEIADANHLDVRPIEKWHYRLMDEYGKYVVDIYFKRNKNGNISRNTTYEHKTKKWGVAHSKEDLIKKINNNKMRYANTTNTRTNRDRV